MKINTKNILLLLAVILLIMWSLGWILFFIKLVIILGIGYFIYNKFLKRKLN
jgi:uncharacterized SAM-binding protein YcdF (DUF218 family)